MKLIFSNGIDWNFKLIWQGGGEKVHFYRSILSNSIPTQKSVFLPTKESMISEPGVLHIINFHCLCLQHKFAPLKTHFYPNLFIIQENLQMVRLHMQYFRFYILSNNATAKLFHRFFTFARKNCQNE